MDPHSLDILEYAKVKGMLAGYAASSLGRAEIETLEPMTDPDRVRRAIGQTTEVRQLIELKGRLPAAGMTDVRPAVAGTEGGEAALEPETIGKVRTTLLAALAFKRLFEDCADLCPTLAALGERLGDFEELCDRIEAVVDADGGVRDDASPKLQAVRGQLQGVRQRLRSKAYALAQSAAIRPLLQTEKVSVRHDRYVLAVKAERKHQVDGIIHDRSQTGATVYVEPRELVLLANELDDLRFEERREVTRLLWDLTFAVRDQRQPLLATLDALAVVDAAYAKARFSIDYAMAPPAISEAGRLEVRQARHPLLVRVLERSDEGEERRVVPIDYRLGEEFDLLVITGPNTGGKTVALKTIGLLALMAQSGMHVPCDPGACFPLYTNILADIGDEQSIEQSLSTFSSHMTNIVRVLGKAHERT
ncbi:MAG: endonuclease MutS2, partial [Planctomycetota bacterium]